MTSITGEACRPTSERVGHYGKSSCYWHLGGKCTQVDALPYSSDYHRWMLSGVKIPATRGGREAGLQGSKVVDGSSGLVSLLIMMRAINLLVSFTNIANLNGVGGSSSSPSSKSE